MGQTKVDKLIATELREGTRSVPSGTAQAHIADAGDTTANPGAMTVGAALGAFTDPPTAGEMATLVTRINQIRADILALAAIVATLETDGDLYTDRINKLIDVTEAFQETATS